MNKPCAKCPFRTDIDPYLTHARAREIVRSLRDGSLFPCHETVDYDDDEGEGVVTSRSVFCAGALITMEKEGVLDLNQMARIEMRLGIFNPEKLDMEAPVPKSLRAWVARHRTRKPRRKEADRGNAG